MEFRALKYFLAVARLQNITAAANHLHLTQPTLSRQLKELEEDLGVKLFVRHSHSVSLTSDGLRLLKRASEIIELVEKAQEEFSHFGASVTGDVYIGAGETKVMTLVAQILQDIRNQYPEIRFHIHSGNSTSMIERLDRGLLDFGIVIQPADIRKYNFLNLPQKDRWGVITRKDSKLAKKDTILRDDLIDVPLILSKQVVKQTDIHNDFIEWFGEDYDKLQVVATYNLVYNAAILVKAGIGHVITIDGLADISDKSELCFRYLEPRLETGLNIIWKKNQIFSPAANIFLEKLLVNFSDG